MGGIICCLQVEIEIIDRPKLKGRGGHGPCSPVPPSLWSASVTAFMNVLLEHQTKANCRCV